MNPFKKKDGLSYWAKIRDVEDESFIVISQAWSAIIDRWGDGFAGKIAITCMAVTIIFLLIAVSFLLQSYFPTFDPTR